MDASSKDKVAKKQAVVAKEDDDEEINIKDNSCDNVETDLDKKDFVTPKKKTMMVKISDLKGHEKIVDSKGIDSKTIKDYVNLKNKSSAKSDLVDTTKIENLEAADSDKKAMVPFDIENISI